MRQMVFLSFNFDQKFSTTFVIELFDDVVPLTAAKFHSLCTNSQCPSFFNTRITRLVAPEFILQAGGGSNADFGETLFTESELSSETTLIDEKGLVCVATTKADVENAAGNNEFFITLTNGLHHFEQLRNKYIVLGRVLKGLDEIIEKLGTVQVDIQDVPILSGKGFYVEKLGELRLKRIKEKSYKPDGEKDCQKDQKHIKDSRHHRDQGHHHHHRDHKDYRDHKDQRHYRRHRHHSHSPHRNSKRHSSRDEIRKSGRYIEEDYQSNRNKPSRARNRDENNESSEIGKK